jgi:hypothetical protein
MEKICCTDRIANDEVSLRVKEERNALHTINRRTVTSNGHILRRNCLLKHVLAGRVEGRLEVMGRRGRRREQLLDDLKKGKKGYWKLKDEVVARTVWKNWLCKRLWTLRKTGRRMKWFTARA